MNILEAQSQRPKIHRRIDASIGMLAPLVMNAPGGTTAIDELKNALLALEVQNRLEWELLSNGTATMDPQG